MTYLEPTTTYPTGSIDGVTYHRRGPLRIARARARPTKVPRAWDPTSAQANGFSTTTPTNAISQLSIDWELLTDAQRIAWGAYALASPLTDAWGHPRLVKGYAHYMRSNRPRLMFGLPLIQDAPTTPGFPSFTNPAAGWTRYPYELQIVWNAIDEWNNEDNALLYVWLSNATSASATRPPESYYPANIFTGASSPHPAVGYVHPINPNAGDAAATWTRYAVQRADGRYTSQ